MIPEIIEIVPPAKSVTAEVTVPGSKSITNRALILAALADGEVTLRGALWSEDTQVMVDSLQRLGFRVAAKADRAETCNRTLVVRGLAGKIPKGGTPSHPLELFVGNAGTAARFLTALVCLGSGVYRLKGTARMHERPQSELFGALRQLGYRVDSSNGRLPAVIHGDGSRPGAACSISTGDSSQFASALALSAARGGWRVKFAGPNAAREPYLNLTRKMILEFPNGGGEFQIEPDASSASYFCAAAALWPQHASLKVARFPTSDWQIDAAFPKFIPLPRTISRRTQLGDSILTAMILAPFAESPVKFTHLERLRVQECERVAVLRTELTKCGAKVVEKGQCLTLFPGAETMHGATIDTYHDHRIAMCFAILGLKIPGIKINNPACVKKTFPNFFQKLAARPPAGLGVVVLDARGRRLSVAGLFAGDES
jgi:3-phosphoshikimate 1-carboxyvinyltransferase